MKVILNHTILVPTGATHYSIDGSTITFLEKRRNTNKGGIGGFEVCGAGSATIIESESLMDQAKLITDMAEDGTVWFDLTWDIPEGASYYVTENAIVFWGRWKRGVFQVREAQGGWRTYDQSRHPGQFSSLDNLAAEKFIGEDSTPDSPKDRLLQQVSGEVRELLIRLFQSFEEANKPAKLDVSTYKTITPSKMYQALFQGSLVLCGPDKAMYHADITGIDGVEHQLLACPTPIESVDVTNKDIETIEVLMNMYRKNWCEADPRNLIQSIVEYFDTKRQKPV